MTCALFYVYKLPITISYDKLDTYEIKNTFTTFYFLSCCTILC